ncbi:MAG: hypothetical protein ACYC1P_13050 [Gaiellaceae bacterium]
MIKMRLRRRKSPYSDERLSESHHVGMILYEMHRAIGAALEAGPERARLSDSDLRGILYRAAYVLNYQHSPLMEKIARGTLSLGGFEPPSTKPDGSDHYRRGRRDGRMDKKRRERLPRSPEAERVF